MRDIIDMTRVEDATYSHHARTSDAVTARRKLYSSHVNVHTTLRNAKFKRRRVISQQKLSLFHKLSQLSLLPFMGVRNFNV